jgi:acyl-CoA synthetase (AMP-forming)/AMP-acid ligase II
MDCAIPGSRAVEVVLRRHPCVWDVAAVAVTAPSGLEVMAAVVQLAGPLPDAAAELASHCRRHLPAAQVPAEWVFTDAPGAAAARPPQAPGQRAPRIPAQAPRAPHLDL